MFFWNPGLFAREIKLGRRGTRNHDQGLLLEERRTTGIEVAEGRSEGATEGEGGQGEGVLRLSEEETGKERRDVPSQGLVGTAEWNPPEEREGEVQGHAEGHCGWKGQCGVDRLIFMSMWKYSIWPQVKARAPKFGFGISPSELGFRKYIKALVINL